MKNLLLRELPKVDDILGDHRIKGLTGDVPYHIVISSIRSVLDGIRQAILSEADFPRESLDFEKIIETIEKDIEKRNTSSLRKVINATGVALHTNLGRARLSDRACDAVIEVSKNYSNLEYNIESGNRGSRHDHVEHLIIEITGAEAAMVVNNNAAATMLCLSALGKDKEIIVSRGELVEIGGSFRVPDIMEESGAKLIEVGTTNKTKLKDYEDHITEDTAALMKVHTSNYKIIGFTEEATLPELVGLGQKKDLPVIYDMGSGLLLDLAKYGIDEPTVTKSIEAGIDVILFSGDKLLGGPQGGILAGKKAYIDKMKKHPLARVVRVDKMTLAAMEATFRAYLDPEKALSEIPSLRMITQGEDVIYERACKFAKGILEKTTGVTVSVEKTEGQIGGGTTPATTLSGYSVSVESDGLTAARMEERLREGICPVIARISQDKLYIDFRTVSEGEETLIAEKLLSILN